jgi:hypothetical protein
VAKLSEKDGVTVGSKKLHDEEHHDFYSSSNIRMIKSRMRSAGHEPNVGEMRNA